jgi:hypothetical protein
MFLPGSMVCSVALDCLRKIWSAPSMWSKSPSDDRDVSRVCEPVLSELKRKRFLYVTLDHFIPNMLNFIS